MIRWYLREWLCWHPKVHWYMSETGQFYYLICERCGKPLGKRPRSDAPF